MRRATMLAALLVAMTAAVALAQEAQTSVRVFHIRNSSLLQAATAVLPLLSDAGSVTIQPRDDRVTVQDVPEVMSRVAAVLATLDRRPERYRIRAELLAGSSAAPGSGSRSGVRADVDARLRRMFPFTSYRQIGATVFEGEVGSPAAADLGEGHRLSFLANSLRGSQDAPWGMPDMGDRVQLQELTLAHLEERPDGQQKTTEILRTSVFLSPSQEVFIGAGASEGSKRGLVLILYSEAVGEH